MRAKPKSNHARIPTLDPGLIRGLAKHVEEALREAIIAGRFQPGEKLNERQLASELGVSTTPIKEALQRLQVDGLVRIEPRRGIYAKFDAKQAGEMSLARAALEGMIARQAATNATGKDIEALEQAVGRMREATKKGNVAKLIALNKDVHDLIQRASGCTYLVSLQEGLHIYERLTRAALLGSAAERERVLREHKAIAVAIGARDPDRAERAMRDHVIRSGHQHIRLAFGENGDFKR